MFDTIVKRDGRKAEFDKNKITVAILSAFGDCGISAADARPAAEQVADAVVQALADRFGEESPSIEEIQDTVEAQLSASGRSDVAKAYILYRADRTRAREMNTRLMQTLYDLTNKSAIESDIKRENANINGDTAMGVMLKYGSESAKQFNSMFVIRPEYAAAHQNGDIHIHDFDFLTLTTTCCQIDLLQLFHGGFSTGHGLLREPKDIRSYAALACIAIQANQNDQHGGQSVVNFDYAMAEGVRKTFRKRYRSNVIRAMELLCDAEDAETPVRAYTEALVGQGLFPTLEPNAAYRAAEAEQLSQMDVPADVIGRIQAFAQREAKKETDRATYQAMEALIHNLNTMNSRAGAQVPFSSINYGMDTSPEARMAIRNLLLTTEAGLGGGETPIFPIQIFRVKEGVNYNPGEPNYDLFKLAIRVSAKRLFPNFSFQDAPYNLKYYKPGHPETEIAYMGCRTRVMANIHDPSREISNSRGNLSFTSVNLPRLAIEAHGDVDKFFESLDRIIDLCIGQLKERFEIQARKHVRNFPFLMGQGVWLDSEKLDWDDEVREVLKHGTLSVGFIGLAETLKALIGVHHGESPEAQQLGLRIIGHMRQRMDDESRKTGLNFTLLATPAEGLSGRFVAIDRKRYGEIPGVTDRDYYTNSFHVPVYFPIGAVRKIRLEAPYHELTNAGHISYVELDGDTTQNLEAFEKIVRVMKESGIGYGSINHPVDRDPVCGYNGLIGDECPFCHRREDGDVQFERIRRITGYLVGTLDRFNNAKRSEERDRVKHGIQ
ncbi:MAG: anaerobic ribonucleoside triphosphate reductase [Clostridia bacterium]|nr:anaerobic ribonucleoside triphosphate reductase [Clostridia bacterium]